MPFHRSKHPNRQASSTSCESIQAIAVQNNTSHPRKELKQLVKVLQVSLVTTIIIKSLMLLSLCNYLLYFTYIDIFGAVAQLCIMPHLVSNHCNLTKPPHKSLGAMICKAIDYTIVIILFVACFLTDIYFTVLSFNHVYCDGLLEQSSDGKAVATTSPMCTTSQRYDPLAICNLKSAFLKNPQAMQYLHGNAANWEVLMTICWLFASSVSLLLTIVLIEGICFKPALKTFKKVEHTTRESVETEKMEEDEEEKEKQTMPPIVEKKMETNLEMQANQTFQKEDHDDEVVDKQDNNKKLMKQERRNITVHLKFK